MNNKVSRIQHFSLGDGPGIRTTVFMQGCNLRCRWCHNPETISLSETQLYYENRCTHCGLCEKICPQNAISFKDGIKKTDRNLCTNCALCEKVCPQSAIAVSGKTLGTDEVFAEIMSDYDFYASSGGVTFSGGEPMLFADFVAEIAKSCKEKNIHTLVDTAGCVKFCEFEKVIPYIDMFYFDLKASNEEDFKEYCGGDFLLVTDNLKKLNRCADVTVRMPIIPGYSDSKDYIEKCAQILSDCGVDHCDILPFHRLGSSKYTALNMEYKYQDTLPPTKEKMEELKNVMKNHGIECRIEK